MLKLGLDQVSSDAFYGIAGAIACTAIFALTIGLTYPLLAFILEAQGYDETAIGFNAAMTPLGVLVASPLYPRLTKRFGGWQVAVVCLVATAAVLLLLGWTQDYVAFLVLRFLLGVIDAGVFIISETWINLLAPQRLRGRVVGLYATALSGGFAAGPLILSVTGVAGFTPFAIGASLCSLSVLVVLAIRNSTPSVLEGHNASSLSFVTLAPTLLIAVGALAFWEAALLSLFPLYGLDYGLEQRFLTLAIAICVLGNTFLQVPIGWIADRVSRRNVMIACAVVSAAGAAAFPVITGANVLFLSILFVWGAAVGGLYTMAMAELGDRFTGTQLVAGNAAFAIAFGLGGLMGGPITGVAMDVAGSGGLPWTLTTVFLATAAFAYWRHRASKTRTDKP